DGFQVVLEAVDHRDERYGDQPGFPVDQFAERIEIDAPVFVRAGDAEFEALPGEFAVLVEGSFEMQRIGDHVAAGSRQIQGRGDEVLANGGTGDEGDLGRLGVD